MTGGPFLTTSYDYDVALNEYGFPRNPKYNRLTEFHKLLLQYKGKFVYRKFILPTRTKTVTLKLCHSMQILGQLFNFWRQPQTDNRQ